METEKTLTPEESLRVIASTIERTRDSIKSYSIYFLLWGWLLAAANFTVFALENMEIKYPFFPFPIAVAAGIIFSLFVYMKRRSRHTETYATFFLSRLWSTLAICFVITVFTHVYRGQSPISFTLMLGGIGTLVSGWIIKFKPLVFGGILFLCAAGGSIFIKEEYLVLIQGIVIIIAYLIPGYLLKWSENK